MQSYFAQVFLLLSYIWKAHTFSVPSIHTPRCMSWWSIVSVEVCNKKHEVILASSEVVFFSYDVSLHLFIQFSLLYFCFYIQHIQKRVRIGFKDVMPCSNLLNTKRKPQKDHP